MQPVPARRLLLRPHPYQRRLLCRGNVHTHANGDRCSNCHADAYANGDACSNSHRHTYANGDSCSNRDAYADANSDPQAYFHTQAEPHCYSHATAYGNSDRNSHTCAYADTFSGRGYLGSRTYSRFPEDAQGGGRDR